VVQNYTIDKNGALLWDERTDARDARQLLAGLAAQGFVSEDSMEEEVQKNPCHEYDALDRLSIAVPLEDFTETSLDNLTKLVTSKSALIRKAIGADALPIQRESDRLCFSWFLPMRRRKKSTLTRSCGRPREVAKKQQRVTATEKPADSEKFAFRCFLLRLGFIGPGTLWQGRRFYAICRGLQLQDRQAHGAGRTTHEPRKPPTAGLFQRRRTLPPMGGIPQKRHHKRRHR
jgi:hypothetical protein